MRRIKRVEMKNPVFLTCMAVVFYALQNVIMEMKFAKYSTVAILVIGYSVMLPLTLARISQMRFTGEAVVFPTGAILAIAFMTGILWFLGDYSYVSAYTTGGDLVTITTIIALFPVVASIIKFFFTGAVPNVYQIAGWLLAIIAVYLVGKGAAV
mgnify:CR=1 FL=1